MIAAPESCCAVCGARAAAKPSPRLAVRRIMRRIAALALAGEDHARHLTGQDGELARLAMRNCRISAESIGGRLEPPAKARRRRAARPRRRVAADGAALP